MTKIRLWSDLHLEFSKNEYSHIWSPSNDDKDCILILAGDINTGTSSIPFIEELCKSFKMVIYCHGNHESYGFDLFKNIIDWKKYQNQGPYNFRFLYNESFIFENIRFIGGTMWTNFNNADPMTLSYAHRTMSDYVYTINNDKNITPLDILNEHDKFISFLKNELLNNFIGKTVLITHHCPGNELKIKGRRGDRTSHMYYASIDNIIGNSNIDLAVHGHLHQSLDYFIGSTRVVCNPYGYHNYSVNEDFDKNICIEI